MIRLTGINYKVTEEALQRYHNVNEAMQAELVQWEYQLEKDKAIANMTDDDDIEYSPKPFMAPFEFVLDDYETTDFQLRVLKSSVLEYKENSDGLVDITMTGERTYVIRENIEYLDKIFGI